MAVATKAILRCTVKGYVARGAIGLEIRMPGDEIAGHDQQLD